MKKKLVLFILTVVCLVIGFTGCGGNQSKDVIDSGKIEDEKILKLASIGELDNMTTLRMSPIITIAQKMIYETLVVYEDGEYKPGLAESWEWNDDKTILTMKLRKGITFHDGEKFDASAVKEILEFYRSIPNCAFMKGISTITNIEAPSEYVVEINYKNPYFGVISDLSSPDILGMPSPKCIDKENKVLTSFVGTGPYVYTKFKKGEYTKFTRNENYWKETPYYDEVIVKYIPESSSRVKALQTGEIDLIFGTAQLTYDDYAQSSNIPSMKGIMADQNERTRNIVVNASSELCSDLNVRRAIAHSIDKKAISEGLTYGNEEVADKLFFDGIAYSNCSMNNNWDYNIEKAKKLLDESGWMVNKSTGVREKNGKALKLVFTYPEEVDINSNIATVIKSQLSEAGIDLEIKGLEQMLWWKADYSGEFDLTIWDTNEGATLPQRYFNPWLDSSAGMAAISNHEDKEKVISAINTYLTSGSDDKVKEAFDYIINFSNDQVIDIPITYIKEKIVYNENKISGYNFYGFSEFFDITKLTPKQ